MGATTLRRATPSDAPALGALHVASWRETYAGILPDEMLASLSVEARTAMWASILGDPAADGWAAVHVAADRGRIVGFGSCARQRDEALAELGFNGEIGAIYVLRSHQRLGLGRSLMHALARELMGQDCSAATLWVLKENVAARGFYEHLGGLVVGEKQEEGPGVALTEVAYGWRDLSALLR